MLKSKSASKEKKRKHAPTEEPNTNRRRVCTESSVEDSRDEMADAELDRIGSDMEEGGLDLSLPFQPIGAYAADRQAMLEQCFQVLGEKKLQKMLPDELKSCPLEEIKKLCWEQLEQLSQKNLLQILDGEELTSGEEDMGAEATSTSQQDNNVDSTSSIKDTDKTEEPKPVVEEESDVLSINADTCDSDIEGPKAEEEEPNAKGPARDAPEGEGEGVPADPDAAVAMATDPPPPEEPAAVARPPAKGQLEVDIDKSVSEILASAGDGEDTPESNPRPSPPPATASSLATPLGLAGGGVAGAGSEVCQPSLQQLELLELEMRARAIKALMKASTGKRPS
ncbi:caspase activity and apoptosis inhibitor 1 [Gadus chalcogrammus]|uniref:caspase activity and apoptosis inhibitor 1 n=1 Tax=Gadus chalcogrammus TaxID=1042646 RepID=UPI0024C4C8A9|nr:caspase activity and apoptosis inhibitor 1 [Gadus chalcogrammus]